MIRGMLFLTTTNVPVHVAGLAAGAIRQPSRSQRGQVLTEEPASGLHRFAGDIGAIVQPAP